MAQVSAGVRGRAQGRVSARDWSRVWARLRAAYRGRSRGRSRSRVQTRLRAMRGRDRGRGNPEFSVPTPPSRAARGPEEGGGTVSGHSVRASTRGRARAQLVVEVAAGREHVVLTAHSTFNSRISQIARFGQGLA